jgi:hypothetical protein
MAVNPLPPQAYTKEILQKAYTWLLNQNSSIKEMASTQDMLVSLYLKAQRGGDGALETPSIQNFKQELKTLANLMGDLQTPSMPSPSPQPAAPTTFTQPSQTHQPSTNSSANQNVSAPSTPGLIQNLDQLSLQALADVRITLNLSSDTEALRALIALGYKQFKKI